MRFITFHVVCYVLITARSSRCAQSFIFKRNCTSQDKIFLVRTMINDTHFDIVADTDEFGGTVYCPVWLGPMIIAYCTTTAEQRCWCCVKPSPQHYEKYYCIWRIQLEKMARLARFLFKIGYFFNDAVMNSVHRLPSDCHKSMPLHHIDTHTTQTVTCHVSWR